MNKESKINIILSAISIALTAIAYFAFKFIKVPFLLELVVWIIIFLITGHRVLFEAAQKIIHFELLDEKFLMSIASIGALAIGEYIEGIAVMVFYTIGEVFEDMAVSKSRTRISGLAGRRVKLCHKEENGEITDINPRKLAIGDILEIRPGELIPTDCIVEEGTSSINAASMTGESIPVSCAPGSKLMSGTLNIDGILKARVTTLFKDSSSEKIIELVENSTLSKSKTERFISKFATFYTPIVVILAVLVFVLPSIITGRWLYWLRTAMVFLVVSCPCAIVISVPMAFFAGVGSCSKAGLLVKGCDYLEKLASVKAVALDKTGTITKGDMNVISADIDGAALDAIYSGELLSNHPIAKAAAKYLSQKGAKKIEISDFCEITGFGIKFKAMGDEFLVGNAKLVNTLLDGTLFASRNGKLVANFKIGDTLKNDSKDGIENLRIQGAKSVIMLSGDNEKNAKECGMLAGCDEIYYGLTPKEKVDKLKDIMARYKRNVVYVGDGINDAPVLALSDIGIAMGGIGQDAAIEAADAVLMNDSVMTLVRGINIAKKTRLIAYENIIFALGVKLAVLLMAVFGISIMWFAIFADVGVCLLAILNSLRISEYGGYNADTL